jgi:hypothetical protein
MAEKAESQVLLDNIKSQTETQIASFKAEIKTAYEQAIKDATKDGITKESLKTLEDSLKQIEEKTKGLEVSVLEELKKNLDTANEELAKLGVAIKGLKETPQPRQGQTKGFGTLVKEALIAGGYTEEIEIGGNKVKSIKGLKTSKNPVTGLEIKAAIDMTTALSMTIGSTPGVNLGYVTDYGMAQIQINLTKDTHLIDGVIPVMPTQDKYIGVFVEYSYEDGVGTAAEGTEFSKSSLKFKTLEFKVFDIGTIFHVAVNQLEDVDQMESRLNRIAPDKIKSSIDDKILSSAGDNSTDIKGMLATDNFTEFDPTTWQGQVRKATVVDVISKMKLQAELADEDVNIAILHPSTVSEIAELKNLNEDSIQDRRLTFDANGNIVRVCGLAIVKNKKVTANEAVVMWNEAAEIGMRKDVEMTIGLENDDLSKRYRTILFYTRVAFGVAKPAAIIYSDDVEADRNILLEA